MLSTQRRGAFLVRAATFVDTEEVRNVDVAASVQSGSVMKRFLTELVQSDWSLSLLFDDVQLILEEGRVPPFSVIQTQQF